MSDVKFSYGTKAQFDDVPYSDGTIYFIVNDGEDVGRIYTDMKNHRVTYSEEMPEITPYDDSELRNQIQNLQDDLTAATGSIEEIQQNVSSVQDDLSTVQNDLTDTIEDLEDVKEDVNVSKNDIQETKEQLTEQQAQDELLTSQLEVLKKMLGWGVEHKKTTIPGITFTNSDMTIPNDGTNVDEFTVDMTFSDESGEHYEVVSMNSRVLPYYDKTIKNKSSYLLEFDDGVPRIIEGIDTPSVSYELRSDWSDVAHFACPLKWELWKKIEQQSENYTSYPSQYKKFLNECIPDRAVVVELEFNAAWEGMYSLVKRDRTFGSNGADQMCAVTFVNKYSGEYADICYPYDTSHVRKIAPENEDMTEEQINGYNNWQQAMMDATATPEAFDEFIRTRCYYDNLRNYCSFAYMVQMIDCCGQSMCLLTYDNFEHVLVLPNINGPDECFGGAAPGGSMSAYERWPIHYAENNVFLDAFVENYKEDCKAWLTTNTAEGAVLDYHYILSRIQDAINLVGSDRYAQQAAHDPREFRYNADHLWQYSYYENLMEQRWPWAPSEFGEEEIWD